MTIYDYAKLKNEEKVTLLKTEGLFIELHAEDQDAILVYFLNGFFVEVTVREGKLIYILPYQRGYMMSNTRLFQKEKLVI